MRIANEPDPDDPAPGTESAEETEERTETVPTQHGPDEVDAEGDVVSDPALDDRLGSDWADEGGATTVGPATTAPGGEAAADGDDPKRRARIEREREERRGKEEGAPSNRGETGLPRITLDPPD